MTTYAMQCSTAALLALLTTAAAGAEEAVTLRVDFAHPNGVLRPLHGINKGPLGPGGLIDVTEQQRALGIPFTRLHDCHWPNPDVVDIHALFPDANADPERPESYDFRLTDEYLAAVRATGAEIVFRLGESIEHTSVKRWVHPPKDPEKWGAICLGVIRHYNEGWAEGFRHGIRYWEVWNEPENRPACWTGTDNDYFALYRATARAIKARYPELKVGGPAVGGTGRLVEGRFEPSEFVTAFLDFCRRESLPLDFFSWHCYTADPAELAARASGIRLLLDARGFTRTESHLNEWNYLPDNRWDGLSRTATPAARQAFYERMGGAEGAAFVAAALLELQDAPVDVCSLFHGELGNFGIFSEHGVPLRVYHALLAFGSLLDAPRRVPVQGTVPGRLAAAAGLAPDGRGAAVLVSNLGHAESSFRLDPRGLPWAGTTLYEIRVVAAAHGFEVVWKGRVQPGAPISLGLKPPGVALVTLRPAEAR